MVVILARVKSLVRSTYEMVPPLLKVAHLTLDTGSREVRRGGKAIELTPQEYAVLEYLMRHHRRVMPRTLITEYVWDYHFDPRTDIRDVGVTRLGKKNGHARQPHPLPPRRG